MVGCGPDNQIMTFKLLMAHQLFHPQSQELQQDGERIPDSGSVSYRVSTDCITGPVPYRVPDLSLENFNHGF